ncbi:MAG: lipopolysaccharide kinase InaA family protein [Candidatus Binatia bacterium]
MPAASNYQSVSVGEWRLKLLSSLWTLELQKVVLELVNQQPWAKHPQTISLHLPGGQAEGAYLKVFHPAEGSAALKDVLRDSKAFHAWRQGMALSETGFDVPLTIAAGEQRRFRLLRRAFVLTRRVDGQALQLFLRDLTKYGEDKLRFATKRACLKQAANLVRQFHLKGFVHGDMVASNLLVAQAGGSQPIFYLMDNDRTRRYPCWLPHSLWKRNLIQLNRMPLPGITLQDRVRFLHAYLSTTKLTSSDRRLARWLERKTRLRRQQCDGVDASGDFRRLMSWPANFRKPADIERVG